VDKFEMPASPHRIWQALNEATLNRQG